ncbi:DUF4148 domain-containing protein [Paraburkholderia sp.]|uniref:DUF4148 domain-containing protein n=1 Tax=Paraburkholderia sp. TaxID=1926495 RepID=UPI00239A2950|nr:DUF4148 domain-containing protein [Paraburkholderia sp.]MDE1179318.1 DUF4148 domain-containing protein [Paraburkholderia sp.]
MKLLTNPRHLGCLRAVVSVAAVVTLTATPLLSNAQTSSQSTTTRQAEKADLKNLEQNGYKPQAQDPKYPDDVQAAEKKAHGTMPASGAAMKSQ